MRGSDFDKSGDPVFFGACLIVAGLIGVAIGAVVGWWLS